MAEKKMAEDRYQVVDASVMFRVVLHQLVKGNKLEKDRIQLPHLSALLKVTPLKGMNLGVRVLFLHPGMNLHTIQVLSQSQTSFDQ
jgi:hypothetical protein